MGDYEGIGSHSERRHGSTRVMYVRSDRLETKMHDCVKLLNSALYASFSIEIIGN